MDSRWGLTSHKMVLMICKRCRLILQSSAGRGISTSTDAAGRSERGRRRPSGPGPAQVAVEPGEDALVAVDPAVGAAGRAVDVVLVGVEDVLDGPPQLAQRDEELLVVGGRAAQVGLGLEHEQRRRARSRRCAAATGARACRCPPARTGRRAATRGRTRGRCRELAQSETWLVTPFSDTAALNRSVVPTSQLTMNPP